MKKHAFLLILVFLFSASLMGQTGSIDAATHFDMSGFPQWGKDLRRAEIVAFGSFPLMYMFSTFGLDSFRFASNNWDRRYAPWPLAAAGAIGQTQEEKKMTLAIAAGGALLVALADYAIMRYQRSKREREERLLAPETPVIIRRPLYAESEGPPFTEPEIPEPGNP